MFNDSEDEFPQKDDGTRYSLIPSPPPKKQRKKKNTMDETKPDLAACRKGKLHHSYEKFYEPFYLDHGWPAFCAKYPKEAVRIYQRMYPQEINYTAAFIDFP